MLTAHQLDAILPFLDRFEAEDFSAGSWNSSPGQFPSFDLSETVLEFQQTLYDNGWISPSFDWGDWQDTAIDFVNMPQQITSADAETIKKLLTTHVRKERFCEGHLAAMFQKGHIVALMRRLRDLRAKMNK